MRRVVAVTTLLLAAAGTAVQAQTITNGFTYSVATGSGCGGGTHFHSSTGGDFGNPAGKAEVGGYAGAECVRGLSEYDLTGLTNSATAFVTFDVYLMGGLFGQSPFEGNVDVWAYQANNAENIGDYSAATTGFVGSFSTAGLNVGDVISMNIAGIYNTAITGGWSSLGIRLQRQVENPVHLAVTFEDFRLTTNNQSTTATPEPITMTLLGTGLAGVAAARRRRKASAV